MNRLEVSRQANYDDFLAETERRMPQYIARSAQILDALTPDILQQQAMVHPDGFLKIQIGPDNFTENGQVRLHFWVPGRTGTEQPHSHPWHISSHVLMGMYNEYQPRLVTAQTGLRHYKVVYPEGKDERAGVERVGEDEYLCDQGEILQTISGASHSLEAGAVHMSSPDSKGGITLAVISPRFENEAHFYAHNNEPYNEKISNSDIESVIEMVKSAGKGTL